MKQPNNHVIDRLRDVVDQHPDAVAISTVGEPAFTYRQLWDRALAIADQLESCAIDTDALIERRSVVAIYMEKSPELVAAMIGTWLAGRAFVPIVAELPDARRIAILDETGAADAIVASDRVPPDLRARCRIVDARAKREAATSVAPAAAAAATAAATAAAVAVDRAYIIYTSGSTGRPKGVVVSHRGLVNLLDAQIRAFDLHAGDRSLWVLSPSFDASISDVFTALLAGASLHIEHPARLRSPSSLVGVLQQRRITHVDLPPSLLPLLSPDDAPSSLRTVVIGGEVCASAAVRAWSSRVRLVNVYGPTEATVCSALCVCDPSWSRPLIGRPLPDVELRIVDGELWIGGIGVAVGYVASPELEATKFVTLAGARWFRTGDRVVEHADGEIEFLGRVDRQLKVQGVLVAPEEIEARLREHPSIAQAVVIADRGDRTRGARDRGSSGTRGVVATAARESVERRDVADAHAAPGDRFSHSRTMLVAYCVPSSSPAPNAVAPWTAELRAHLAATLDPRLIPRRIVLVDALPRTPSGKVDVAALPRARWRCRSVDAPNTATERDLATLWQRILDLDTVGRDDNFFDLGGDSFAVVELLAMAELAGVPLSADDVYEAPVLADLASRADGGIRAVGRSCGQLIEDVSPIVAWSSRERVVLDARTAIDSATATTAVATAPDVSTATESETSPGARTLPRSSSSIRRIYELGGGISTSRPSRSCSASESILLTGATGFLGAHVLAELVGRAVTCVVRAADDTSARNRVATALARVVGGADLRLDSVTCIAGDVSAPRFGLGDRWSELADRIDTIVHCAADVSVTRPYAELRAANVEGTARVLELAATARPKRLHHASTLSVFVGGERDGVIGEDDSLETAARLHGGYAQSKWASEWLVRRVASDAAIYRFGLLTGDTRNGRGAERDWLTWFVRGLASVGAYPRIAEARVDLTPIDYASRAMAKLVLDGASGTFHIANPRAATLAEIASAVRRAGVAIRECTRDEFVERVRGARTDGLVALLGACRAGDSYERVRPCDVFQASGMMFDTRRTDAALAGSGIACPEPSEALLDRYVARMLA